MNKIFTTLIVVLFTCFSSFSQTNFREGFIITLENDTIYGHVDSRGELRSSRICVFRHGPETEPVRYLPGEIIGYRYLDSKFYVSREIDIMEGDLEVPTTVFLEFLVNGIFNLYFLPNSSGDNYFIETQDGTMVRLSNEMQTIYVPEENKEYVKYSNRHIGLLKATFADSNQIQEEINSVKLSHKSLINITKNYHDYVCQDGMECIIYEKALPGISVKLAPFIEMEYSEVEFTFDDLYSRLDFSDNKSPTIGLRADFMFPRLNSNFSLPLDVTVNNTYYFAHIYEFINLGDNFTDVHVNTVSLKSSLGIKYTYPKGVIRPTATFGGTYNILFDNGNKTIEEKIYEGVVNSTEVPHVKIAPRLWGLTGQLGFNIHLTSRHVFFVNAKYSHFTGRENQKKNLITFTDMISKGFNIGFYF